MNDREAWEDEVVRRWVNSTYEPVARLEILRDIARRGNGKALAYAIAATVAVIVMAGAGVWHLLGLENGMDFVAVCILAAAVLLLAIWAMYVRCRPAIGHIVDSYLARHGRLPEPPPKVLGREDYRRMQRWQ